MLKEFNEGVKIMFKEFFNRETNKRQRANMWTFSRLVLAFLIPIMALIGKLMVNPIFYGLAVILTTIGTFTDFMDGRSARKHKSISIFGKKLDMLADKVFAFMQGISLSLFNPLFILNIIGEATISYTNIHYQKKYQYLIPKSSYIGKVKQWPLSIAFVLGYLSIFFPQLTMITNTFILTSFIMEIAVFKNYIDINNFKVKEYHKNCCPNIKKEEITKDKEKSLKEEYIKLRNVLLEIKETKETEIEKTNIKVKKRQS